MQARQTLPTERHLQLDLVSFFILLFLLSLISKQQKGDANFKTNTLTVEYTLGVSIPDVKITNLQNYMFAIN